MLQLARDFGLCKHLPDNLLFLGIQGSYGRGEAKETSDINPMIILQHCGKDEILKYKVYTESFLTVALSLPSMNYEQRRVLTGHS